MSKKVKSAILFWELPIFGRSVGIRTRGLLDPNQARYQTSPHPVSLLIIVNKQRYVKGIAAKFSLVHGHKGVFPAAISMGSSDLDGMYTVTAFYPL